jgi:LmeA-like phospholipid-binding
MLGVRKLLIGLGTTLLAGLIAAVAVDFGAAVYAEYRLARSVRAAAHLNWDPSAIILGFPFAPQALRRHYEEVEIKANDVEHALVGRAALEATLHSVDLTESSWLIPPDAVLPVSQLESRIIIDSRHVGQYLGIKDLMVEAPSPDTNGNPEKTTESGISDSHGLVFTGTPTAAGLDKPVSVSVDLSMAGADRTTLVFTATGILTDPGTAERSVPEEDMDAVLAAFSAELPGQRLPFGLVPTSQGARGSDVIIEGIAEGVTIGLDGFRQS